MRLAFVPTSLRPTRDTERTSTRVPLPHGITRTTTSSSNPNQRVVSVAFHLTHNPCAKGETGCAFDIVDLQAALSPQKAVVTVTWDEDRADMAKAKKTLGPIAK